MNLKSSGDDFSNYLQTAFRWQRGRQQSGYDKMLIVQGMWPLPFDFYLLRFPQGSEIKSHTDKVASGKHYRLNIVVKPAAAGGKFKCTKPIFESEHIKFFRPDISEHSVSRIEVGSRYVLSIGWILH